MKWKPHGSWLSGKSGYGNSRNALTDPRALMPDIPVSADNLKRLQEIVRSVETIDDVVVHPCKTIDNVVGLLLDRHEKKLLKALVRKIPPSVVGKGLFFGPEHIPPLASTKLRYAALDGNELMRPTWKRLAGEMLDIAFERFGSFDALRRVTDAKIVEGIQPRSGYNALSRAPISFQGVNADKALQITASLARRVNVPFIINFEWPLDDSEHSGEIGACAWWPYDYE